MTITYNGEKTELADGTRLGVFLREKGYRPQIIAVEINLAIVPKSDYETVVLKEGDTLEVVSFMGGG